MKKNLSVLFLSIKGTAEEIQQKRQIFMAAKYLGIGADLVQLGLEITGHKELGRITGIGGNIAAGVMVGYVAGPGGAAIGTFGGFMVYGIGELVSGLVNRCFGN